MRVVVTRPKHTGEKTAATLHEMGHDAVLLPLVTAEHDCDAARTALAAPWSALTVTSAQALAVLAEAKIDLRPFAKKVVFAVGEATATAAREAGFATVLAADGYGESLARLIGQHIGRAQAQTAPLLYLAGVPRSPALEASLDQFGILYQTANCYRMMPIDWTRHDLDELLAVKPVDAVLLFSTETARLFFNNIVFDFYEDQLRHTRFFCLSEKVAAAVPEAFSGNVHISCEPSQAALLDLLKSY